MEALVIVGTYSRAIDAQLARTRLEGLGISAFLLDESIATIDPLLMGAVGGIKLQVRLSDEVAAREALDRSLDEEPDDDADTGEAIPRCPMCDSEYVSPSSGARATLARAGGAGVTFTCGRCGHTSDPARFAARRIERADLAAGDRSRSRAARPPVFRLVRRRGLIGGVVGLVAGFPVVIAEPSYGALPFVVGLVIGTIVGRESRYAVCSDPGCRAPIHAGAEACPGCKRRIGGSVDTEGEHFMRVAEWKRENVLGSREP